MGNRSNAFFKGGRIIIPLLILIMITGCREEPVEISLCDAGNYFPLEENTWWKYRN